MKSRLFVLLIINVINYHAFSQTFDITIDDTLAMIAFSDRAIELADSSFLIYSSGFNGNVNAGTYERFLRVKKSGEILNDKFLYRPSGRITGIPQIKKYYANTYLIANSELYALPTLSNRLFVLKVDSSLNDTLWSYFNSDTSWFDITQDLIFCNNADVILLATRSISSDSMRTVFLRINSNGELISNRIYSFTKRVECTSIVELVNGSFIIGGSKQDEGEQVHGLVFKVDSLGNLLWQRDYTQLIANGLSLYDSTSVLLSGYVPSASSRPRLLRLNVENGDIIFDKQNNYTQTAELYISRKLSDNDIFSVGLTSNTTESNSGFYMRCDSMGNPIYLRRVNYLNEVDFFIDFIETSDGGILINGAAADTPEEGGQNLWLVKLDSLGCLEPNCWVGVEQTQANTLGVSVYPNPATDWLYLKYDNTHKITLEIFNLSGQRVLQHQHMAPKEGIEISHLPAGLYLLRFVDEQGNVATEKIVVER